MLLNRHGKKRIPYNAKRKNQDPLETFAIGGRVVLISAYMTKDQKKNAYRSLKNVAREVIL